MDHTDLDLVNQETTTQDTITATASDIQEIEAELASLLSSNSNQLGGTDVAELLKHLTDANTIAESMESKLDTVLQNLDGLLSALDSVGNDKVDDGNSSLSTAHAQPNNDVSTNTTASGNPS